jgi:uncharacterized protein
MWEHASGRGSQTWPYREGDLPRPKTLTPQEELTLAAGDATAPEALIPLLAGSDAVISAMTFRSSDPGTLIDAVRRSG